MWDAYESDGKGSLYRGKDILGKACMCDTYHSRIISFALVSKQEREENFGHNKKRAKGLFLVRK